VYTDIQDASNYLFLVVILTFTPTECTAASFKRVRDTLVSLQSYDNYQLDIAEKNFFQATATEQGFISNSRYLSFMNILFPQVDNRIYQLAYSGIPVEKIDIFFELLRKGIETGSGWREERARGDKISNFVVSLVPTGDKDVCFQITVGRRDGMESLGQCKFERIKL